VHSAYAWAGYQSQSDFYAHCGAELAKAAPTLGAEQIAEACVLFGTLQHYQRGFFQAAQRELLNRNLLETELNPREVAAVSSAFAAHLRTAHDDVQACVAGIVELC